VAFDTFLSLDGVKGESQDSSHQGWIEILSFQLGASNPSTIGSATGGAGGGKATLSEFTLTKNTDASSPNLFQGCCSGVHYKKATIALRKAGGTALVYLQYDFTEVFISSVYWSGSAGSGDTPNESVSLAYGSINVTYTPQKVDGTAGSAVVAGWDVKANAKL
jgi:type VI secretion system secreted protein Hcp